MNMARSAAEDLLTKKIFVVGVEFRVQTGDFHWPLEVGYAEFSLQEGISNFDNFFVKGVQIPTGMLADAMIHSENSHRVNMQTFDRPDVKEMLKTSEEILDDITWASGGKDNPSVQLYCHCHQLKAVRDTFAYLKAEASLGEDDFPRLCNISPVEDLLVDMISRRAMRTPDDVSVKEALRRGLPMFHYSLHTKCRFHEDIEVHHCALSIAKSICYSMALMLKDLFPYQLTKRHVPQPNFLKYAGNHFRYDFT